MIERTENEFRALLAEAMLLGAQFPPVVVFGEGGEEARREADALGG